jgi:hypothetical protein
VSLSRMSHSLINISSSTDSQRFRSFDTASSTGATPPSSSSAVVVLMDRTYGTNKYSEVTSEPGGVIRKK